jgi:RNA polymerase sigma-70 factor, ECF subfamily
VSGNKTDELRGDLRAAWHGFVDATAPLRPVLHAYCRRLTGTIWDAEDLVQDTLLRAFASWGVTHPAIADPKSYLLRIATNLWVDRLRREGLHADYERAEARSSLADAPASANPDFTTHVRDAGARLIRSLPPQERAAIVLKEAFDMSIDEIAHVLATTPGAVKAALHRGRERLRADPPATARPQPSRAVLDAFIERFNAQDVPGLVALMLETGSAENVGNSIHIGAGSEDGLRHFFTKVVHGHEEWPAFAGYESSRLERTTFDGEPVILSIVKRKGQEALMAAFRFETEGDRIVQVRAYGFCPDTIRAIGEELGLSVFTGLYRAPDPVATASTSVSRPHKGRAGDAPL